MTERDERLYALLPAYHQLRDVGQGNPLKHLLQVIAEQVNVVEDDIGQLYDNWFIETCQDWVVPYIGDLIGFSTVFEAGEPGDPTTPQTRARNKILIPRREVANTIRYRRRKGTLSLLELLANNVADWPARAVEFYKLLAWMQHLNHQRLNRGRTVDLRDGNALDLINGPFDTLAHTVDVRRINSTRTRGRYNIPSVGLFVWRLKSYPVTKTQAYCLEAVGYHCYTFSALGNNTQLYINPQPEAAPTDIAQELNVPAPIRRRALVERVVDPLFSLDLAFVKLLDKGGSVPEPLSAAFMLHHIMLGSQAMIDVDRASAKWTIRSGGKSYRVELQDGTLNVYTGTDVQVSADLYGDGKSLQLWAADWPTKGAPQPVPRHCLIAADLTDWAYRPQNGYIAIDPVLGRIAFPPKQCPKRSVHVTYHYGFSADLGGGEYIRASLPVDGEFERYRVTRIGLHAIDEQLQQWESDEPDKAVIEIEHSRVYDLRRPIEFQKENQTLILRAAELERPTRPILRIHDFHIHRPDACTVRLLPGCHIVLDGLLVVGRGVRIEHAGMVETMDAPMMDPETVDEETMDAGQPESSAESTREEKPKKDWPKTMQPSVDFDAAPACLHIRHSTLVPGWSLHNNCRPTMAAEPSLDICDVNVRVLIEDSILGSIRVQQEDVNAGPIPIHIRDSILDATDSNGNGPHSEALSAPDSCHAHAILTIQDSTVLGAIFTHTIELGENTIFDGKVHVVRSQRGCLRFSYVRPESRTPRRFNCQPDLVEKPLNLALQASDVTNEMREHIESERVKEQERVRPRFNSRRYGTPDYCQLREECADEIKRGADDTSEMGAFHDLYQPQRLANLRARLEEFAPAGVDAGIIIAS